jgi:hypothetical protein
MKLLSVVSMMLLSYLCQGQNIIQLRSNASSTDTLALTRYLETLRRSRLAVEKDSVSKRKPLPMNFPIPKVKIYNAANYYADGKFSCLPFHEWAHHKTPYHLNQQIIVPLKKEY